MTNILRKSSREKNDNIVELSFVMEAVAEVALDLATLCLGRFVLFIFDDGKGLSVFNVVRNLNVTFILIVRWIKKLNCRRYGLFLESSSIRGE